MMDDTPPAPPTPVLVRSLALVPAAALIVTNVIGTGVFLKARVMTCNVGSPYLVLVAWAAAGLLTLGGALCIAELSAMMPRSGGQYNFIDAAFGKVWAFLYGWMETLLDGAASIAAIATVFVIMASDLLSGTLTPFQVQMAAAVTILVVTLLNLASVRTNGWIASIVTGLKIMLVAGVGIAAFVFGGPLSSLAAMAAHGACDGVPQSSRLGLAGFGAAMVGALWAYNGWSDLSMVAEEVRDPGRTIPRAIISSTLLIIALYLLVNLGYFLVLSPVEIGDLPAEASVAGAVMIKLFGAGIASLLTLGMMTANFGALHSTFLSTSRLPFAMARDGLLPGGLAVISARTHVPSRAIIALGAVAIAFSFSGSFDMLTDVIVFMLLVVNGLAVAAIFVLRRRLPDAPRPYRVPAYPMVAGLFLAGTGFLTLNTLVATPWRAGASILIVATGLPVYAWYSRRRAKTASNVQRQGGGGRLL
jgi:APA family basic amino acid/polyamine antiporter